MIRLRPRQSDPVASTADEHVHAALASLHDAFGGDISFHPTGDLHLPRACGSGWWNRRFQSDAGDDLRDEVEAIVRDAATKPVAREVGNGRLLLGIPVVGNDQMLGVATVVSALDRGGLALQLAEFSTALLDSRREAAERNDQLHVFSEHLSHSLEEVTWFRTLSGSLESCTPDNGLEHVAATSFPTLREVLQAEAVALVTRASGGHTRADLGKRLEFPAWVGKPVVDRDHCREFVASILGGARKHPFVWNFGGIPRGERPSAAGQEIRSCILAEISDRDRLFGWILVLNRVPPVYEIRDSQTGRPAMLGGEEFGTVEATLVASAARMLATHATNVGLFRDQREFTVGVIRSMINVLDARDRYTSGHSDRVAVSSRCLAEGLGLGAQEQDRFYLSGLLHDVGKVGVPDDILLKPGRLTPEEFAVIQRHPQRGVDILQHIKQLRPMLPGVLHHHEAWDGSGYPHGLAGESIPLMARIIAVADAFDAMTTCRPYRNARSVEDAVGVIRQGSGRQWDPRIVRVFLERLDDMLERSQNWESHISRMLNDLDNLSELCSSVDDAATSNEPCAVDYT